MKHILPIYLRYTAQNEYCHLFFNVILHNICTHGYETLAISVFCHAVDELTLIWCNHNWWWHWGSIIIKNTSSWKYMYFLALHMSVQITYIYSIYSLYVTSTYRIIWYYRFYSRIKKDHIYNIKNGQLLWIAVDAAGSCFVNWIYLIKNYRTICL